MPNVLNAEERANVLHEIDGQENRQRKNESLRRYEIFNKRQGRFVTERLLNEFGQETVQNMRIIKSINLTSRFIDEKASLYKNAPTRTFQRRSGAELSENELQQLENIYNFGKYNLAYKKTNKYQKLEDQCALQIIPKGGVLQPKVLLPHHYDVIPYEDDPTKAYCYVISVYDKSLLFNQTYLNQSTPGAFSNYWTETESDRINQKIGDRDDEKARKRFIWWTPEWNFITDGWGTIIDPMGNPIKFISPEDMGMISNALQRLPFVDVAGPKDFEFWVRQGSGVTDFDIDFSVLLSDTAEINKRQGYSQAIIYSEKPPANLLVGPNRVLHIPQDANKEVQPRFEWSTPQPDMQSSLELIQTFLRLFLSSQGMDTRTVVGQGDAQRFSSGIERLLAQIEKFEASRDDIDLMKSVEQDALDISVGWSNLMQGANIKAGVDPLVPELQQGVLPTDIVVNVNYVKPEMMQTRDQEAEEIDRRLERGLLSRKKALMRLDGLSEQEAEAELMEIDKELMIGQGPEGQI